MIGQDLTDLGVVAQYSLDREVFMMKLKNGFDHVRECAMTNVMKQCRNSDGELMFFGNGIVVAKLGENACCEVKSSEAVCEPRVFGCLIGKMRETKLAYSTKPLEFRGIDKPSDEVALGC